MTRRFEQIVAQILHKYLFRALVLGHFYFPSPSWRLLVTRILLLKTVHLLQWLSVPFILLVDASLAGHKTG